MKKQIKVGIADAAATASDFVDAWKRAERGKVDTAEHRLHFEDMEMLLKTLTTSRWILLKSLRKKGPLSIRALAKELGRDYKNVHTDVRRLEEIDLIEQTRDGKVVVPWDVVEAQLDLAA